MSHEYAAPKPSAETVDTKLEVVVIPVSDVDRAKRFYTGLGWREDADFTEYSRDVSNTVPSLYPRLWFQVDGPHYGQPLSALYACPTVALDRPDGTPDPDMEQYDPLHPSYLGAAEAFRP